MKNIFVSKKLVLIDETDFSEFMKYKWFLTTSGYVARHGSQRGGVKQHLIFLHRNIMNAPSGMQVDHINRDTKDNRRCNLRLATAAQNQQNHAKQDKYGDNETSSRYKGVSYRKCRNHWKVSIQVNYKKIYLGSSRSEEDAAKIYDEAAKKYFGEFAILNSVKDVR